MIISMGNYYMVRNGTDVKVEGPHQTWQAAVIAAWGVIDTNFWVKSLGDDERWIKKKAWVNKRKNDPEDWFRPFIPESVLGITVDPKMALGPPEIAPIVRDCALRIKEATTREAARAAWDAANQYLQWVPVQVAARFSDLFNTKMVGFDLRDEAKANGQMVSEGCPHG